MKKQKLKLLSVVFVVSGFFISCGKEVSLETKAGESSSPIIISDTSIYIDITLAGKRIVGVQQVINNSPFGPWGLTWDFGLQDTTLYTANFPGAQLEKNDASGTQAFTFSKGRIYFHGTNFNQQIPASYQSVDSFFTPGNYSFCHIANDTIYSPPGAPSVIIKKKLLTDGINLSWLDTEGNLWQTCAGTGDQTGSNFTIIKNEVTGNPAGNISGGTIVTAVFNCKLYDKNGNVKTLSNGRFRLGLWL